VFVADDHSVAVVVTAAMRAVLLKYCTQAARKETGGIIIGHYTPLGDQAVITEVTGPPRDSQAGDSWFVRGLQGLQRRIDRAWRRRDYYLGEWHFHPFAQPVPSQRDRAQVLSFSKNAAYRCPEPILIVVGGDPRGRAKLWVGAMFGGKLRNLDAWGPKLVRSDDRAQTVNGGSTAPLSAYPNSPDHAPEGS
jgi:integrative and conjugative element protein (TIGR02256 family)